MFLFVFIFSIIFIFFDSALVLMTITSNVEPVTYYVIFFFNLMLILALYPIEEIRDLVNDSFKKGMLLSISVNLLITLLFKFFIIITPFVENINTIKTENSKTALKCFFIVNDKYKMDTKEDSYFYLIGGYKINGYIINSSIKYVKKCD